MNTRRQFLIRAPLGVLVAAAACRNSPPSNSQTPVTPGAPPTFGTGTGSGPEVTPATQLSRWIEARQLTSERLTNIYLSRIERLDGKIRAIITVTKDHALARAKQADAEIAAGKYRGPLHGIPYGVKDLLDTKDIPTTYGAEPFRHRVPSADSFVVRRLNEAGAVLLAELSLGALALNDIWFGGESMNSWLFGQ